MKVLLLLGALSLVACQSSKAAEPVNAPPAVAPVAVSAAATADKPSDPPPLAAGTKAKCAVTGEEFTVTAKTVQTVYEGKRYVFCCPDCAPQFAANPKKFAKN